MVLNTWICISVGKMFAIMHKALGLIPRTVQLGDIVNTCSLNTQWMETDQKLEVSLLCVKPCLRKKKQTTDSLSQSLLSNSLIFFLRTWFVILDIMVRSNFGAEPLCLHEQNFYKLWTCNYWLPSSYKINYR